MKIVKDKTTKNIMLVIGKDRFCFWDLCDCIQSGEYACSYEMPKGKITALFGNWNIGGSAKDILDATGKQYSEKLEKSLLDALEKKFELEWEDEWVRCDECNGFVRTDNGSRYIVFDNCCILCRDCAKYHVQDIIKEFCNAYTKAWQFPEDWLTDNGFTEREGTYDNGFYGSEDKPVEILKELQRRFPDKDFIFNLIDAHMFNTRFNVFERDKSYEQD